MASSFLMTPNCHSNGTPSQKSLLGSEEPELKITELTEKVVLIAQKV